ESTRSAHSIKIHRRRSSNATNASATPSTTSIQRRLSGLFSFEGRKHRASVSEDRTVISDPAYADPKVKIESLNSIEGHDYAVIPKSRHPSSQNQQHHRHSHHSHQHPHHYHRSSTTRPMSRDSMVSSSAASCYSACPNDYANIKQYQTHVWRRNLLEESIMHSLRLGYADRARASVPSPLANTVIGTPVAAAATAGELAGEGSSSPRQHARRSILGSSFLSSSKARKVREQAMYAAAMGAEQGRGRQTMDILNPGPRSTASSPERENIVDRAMSRIPDMSSMPSSNRHSLQPPPPQPQTRQPAKNSPYQMSGVNDSVSNITHSFLSLTLELPEHHATNVLASSAAPNLFMVMEETFVSTDQDGRQNSSHRRKSIRESRNLTTENGTGSPHVLGGAMSAEAAKCNVHAVIEVEEEEEDVDSVETPATKEWIDSVFSSLDKIHPGGGQTEQNGAPLTVAPVV
ncbi:hypothetical protein BGW38_003125, partial [Lunasporangiospora selenospora]